MWNYRRSVRTIARCWRRVLLLLLTGCVPWQTRLDAENWPQWRGPYGTSISYERPVPIFWSEERAITWRCPLPEWGNSSPVVWNHSVFVTSQTSDGKLLLLHIGAQTGRLLWTRQIGTGTVPREPPERGRQIFHRLHNFATPSPVTNGEVVVAHFGNGDLAAYDFNGGQIWKRNLQEDYGAYTIWWGHANSPVIYEDLVISICLQDSLANLRDKPVESYIVAHELATGRTRWKIPRMTGAMAEQCDAYTTPLLIEVRGEPRLVVMGGNQLDAYDPRDGKQIWALPRQTGGRTVTGPTASAATVFATRGQRGAIFALPLGKKGVLRQREILWSNNQGTPDSCTPVAYRTQLFAISDDGLARCYDTDTGRLRWKQRLPGKYKASPVYCDGRILFLNMDGRCTVVAASGRYLKLAENQLDDQTIASPAISNGHIYIRGREKLYCIGPSFR